jgi:hypothetical protein
MIHTKSTRSLIVFNLLQLHIVFLLVASLTGCASGSTKEFQAPDGSIIKTAKCSSDPLKCFALASESCPNGGLYSESHAGGLLADVLSGPVTWYGMTYACGPSDGKMPDFKLAGQQYSPPQLAPAPTKQKPTTTTCTPIGNSMTCNTF